MDRKILLAGALALITSGAFAQDGVWTLGTGLHYSSGDYGTSATTTILSIPFTVQRISVKRRLHHQLRRHRDAIEGDPRRMLRRI